MSLATLLVLADGRLPAGGHAHSGGLEAAVASGRVRDVAGLDGFLRGRLATSGLVAAAFAAAACARIGSAAPLARPRPAAAVPLAETQPAAAVSPTRRRPAAAVPLAETQPAAVLPTGRRPAPAVRLARPEVPVPAAAPSECATHAALLDDGLDARTPSPALRRASRAQGRALLRAGRAMWPMPAIGREPHHPVALGAVAAAAGLEPFAAAVAAAHGTVTGPAGAAVRLLGLDPYAVHALLAALAPACDRIAAEAAARAGDPVDELPAAGAPLLDIGAEQHAAWEVRLFAS
jgi:urease accessory protein